MAPIKASNVKLSNGVEIPVVGLGTYQALGEEIKQSIRDSLDIGYRHFDTADFYRNLEPLGEAIREAIAAGKVTRQEVFITTKVWPTFYSEGRVESSVRRQLKQSGLDYFDLVLLHWPVVFVDDEVEGFPKGPDGKVQYGTRPLPEVYGELVKVQQAGLSRSIGLSNFNSSQIEQVLASNPAVRPVMNQVEAHVYLAQQKLQAFCSERGIALTAYCPLGRGAGGTRPNTFNLLEDETLKSIATKLGKSPAQVALRYLIQRGIIVIPKSIRRERLQSNFELFDFELSPEDFKTLEGLDRGQRIVWFDYFGTKEGPNYPFSAEF